MPTLTPHEAPALLAPFVNLRLHPKRDANGYVLPRTQEVDIVCKAETWRDADVRGVSAFGVSVFFYDRCHLIPWADVRTIRIAALDEDEARGGVREWTLGKSLQVAA